MCKASQDIFKIIGFRHAAPLQGRDAMPRVFLPASKTVKDIHAEHVVPCLANDNKVRVASISVFFATSGSHVSHMYRLCQFAQMFVQSVRKTGKVCHRQLVI